MSCDSVPTINLGESSDVGRKDFDSSDRVFTLSIGSPSPLDGGLSLAWHDKAAQVEKGWITVKGKNAKP